MNAIVISLGGLHAGTLGCYGGEWVDTSAIDRFAANAVVFDQCYVECPCPKATRRNWWTGRFQYFQSHSSRQSVTQQSLIAALRPQGVRSVLVRDTTSLLHRSELDAAGFEQIHEIERDKCDTTQSVFETAMQWLREQPSDGAFLLFLDCHGAHPPWLAADLADDDEADDATHCGSERAAMASDDDFESDRDTEENVRFDQNSETDPEIDSYLRATRHIDEQLGRFLQQLLAGQDSERTLVVITSDVGRSVISSTASAGQLDLAESQIHVPLLVRYPELELVGRTSALVQSIDLVPTVLDAVGVSVPESIDGRSLLPICRLERRDLRDVARLTSPCGRQAIRTANWFLLQTQGAPVNTETAGTAGTRLFVKPDDRWERNDVAKQYPEVLADLSRLLPPVG